MNHVSLLLLRSAAGTSEYNVLHLFRLPILSSHAQQHLLFQGLTRDLPELLPLTSCKPSLADAPASLHH